MLGRRGRAGRYRLPAPRDLLLWLRMSRLISRRGRKLRGEGCRLGDCPRARRRIELARLTREDCRILLPQPSAWIECCRSGCWVHAIFTAETDRRWNHRDRDLRQPGITTALTCRLRLDLLVLVITLNRFGCRWWKSCWLGAVRRRYNVSNRRQVGDRSRHSKGTL